MCQPVVLTTAGDYVFDVATDGTYVYWSSLAAKGSVGKCALSNCAGTATNLVTGVGEVVAIAVQPGESRVFFSEYQSQGLWSVPTSGGAAAPWGPNVGEVEAIWMMPTSFYYAVYSFGAYLSNGVGTYDAPALSSGCANGVTGDSSHTYVTDSCNNRLLVCPLGSDCGAPNQPAPTVISGVPGANKLYYDGTTVWMTGQGTLANHGSDGALYKCGPQSCSTFASAQDLPASVVSDGVNVYWTDTGPDNGLGAVMRSPVGGAAPVKIATIRTPVGLAQTDNALVIAGEDEGQVFLLAK
jgi:hypothetical protein